ncbi:hypothetical protein SETIT_2G003200v2 [Setaria italica]|uniref:Uncharacterized protein n=1 Tax=Setaria italica TaxID=4555 RepID=A0A368PTM4_SETIT|nr:hypothetical protein SETIT_2G003200v2 [Setaria italica]
MSLCFSHTKSHVSLDIYERSIQQSDAPGTSTPSPHFARSETKIEIPNTTTAARNELSATKLYPPPPTSHLGHRNQASCHELELNSAQKSRARRPASGIRQAEQGKVND